MATNRSKREQEIDFELEKRNQLYTLAFRIIPTAFKYGTVCIIVICTTFIINDITDAWKALAGKNTTAIIDIDTKIKTDIGIDAALSESVPAGAKNKDAIVDERKANVSETIPVSITAIKLVFWSFILLIGLLAGAIRYGRRQEQLRGDSIEKVQQRMNELEISIDPGRSSSLLTNRGETRECDK